MTCNTDSKQGQQVRVLCTANCIHNSGEGYYNLCLLPENTTRPPYGGVDRYYVEACTCQERRK